MYPDNREKILKKSCSKKKAKMMWADDRAILKKNPYSRPQPENVKFDSDRIVERLDRPMADAIQ